MADIEDIGRKDRVGFGRKEMFSEDLAGTVDQYNFHIFVCSQDAPQDWPQKVEKVEGPSTYLKRAIELHKGCIAGDVKVQLCTPTCAGDQPGDVLVFPSMLRYRGGALSAAACEMIVKDSLVEKRAGVGVVDSAVEEEPPVVVEVLEGCHTFVCCHTARDARCGVCGPALIDAFKDAVEVNSFPACVSVRGCSHIGGHKYAGTLILFSETSKGAKVEGNWYGYVRPEDASTILEAHLAREEVVAKLWRGQLGMDKATHVYTAKCLLGTATEADCAACTNTVCKDPPVAEGPEADGYLKVKFKIKNDQVKVKLKEKGGANEKGPGDVLGAAEDTAAPAPPAPKKEKKKDKPAKDIEELGGKDRVGFGRKEMFSESLAGTVDQYSFHLFVCSQDLPEKWPQKIEALEGPSTFLKNAVQRHREHIAGDVKVQLCTASSAEDSPGDVLVFPSMLRYRGGDLSAATCEMIVKDALVEKRDRAGAVADTDGELPAMKVETLTGCHTFVCCHTARDARCGVCGPPLISAFKAAAKEEKLPACVSVRGCSHIGGHKLWGRLFVLEVPQELSSCQVVARLWRGQLGMDKATHVYTAKCLLEAADAETCAACDHLPVCKDANVGRSEVEIVGSAHDALESREESASSNIATVEPPIFSEPQPPFVQVTAENVPVSAATATTSPSPAAAGVPATPQACSETERTNRPLMFFLSVAVASFSVFCHAAYQLFHQS
ncbi:hypothetical protein CYMTET_34475 [Cymbomonas tetramitiformis]|uniref:Uncharacterized protein n=1 Tax=Cymbomonas tetramitiformis TaxID=36881 RepID=A0AAE0FB29_9CHLO|nr:hypothetical protein CYMTET_34475 [Cymbomonas tetramitiformis]